MLYVQVPGRVSKRPAQCFVRERYVPLRSRRVAGKKTQDEGRKGMRDRVGHYKPPALVEAVHVEQTSVQQQQRRLDKKH